MYLSIISSNECKSGYITYMFSCAPLADKRMLSTELLINNKLKFPVEIRNTVTLSGLMLNPSVQQEYCHFFTDDKLV